MNDTKGFSEIYFLNFRLYSLKHWYMSNIFMVWNNQYHDYCNSVEMYFQTLYTQSILTHLQIVWDIVQ